MLISISSYRRFDLPEKPMEAFNEYLWLPVKAREMFDSIDMDGDGKISKDEMLSQIIRGGSVGPGVSGNPLAVLQDQVEEAFSIMDTDGGEMATLPGILSLLLRRNLWSPTYDYLRLQMDTLVMRSSRQPS